MNHVPQPRYSKEHQAQAKQDGRPVFTLDIYWPHGSPAPNHYKRSTRTGVLADEEIDEAIRSLQRFKSTAAPAFNAGEEG